jgi:hypothetical protein
MKMLVERAPIVMRLEGEDGNAFAIIGRFQREARKQGWSDDEIDKVVHEATRFDYDYLLRVFIVHTEAPEHTTQTEGEEA